MSTPTHETYRIEHVRDFLQVPPDRLPQCLAEFADFLQLARETTASFEALAKRIGFQGKACETKAFRWIDDGLTTQKISLRFDEL